MPSTRWPSPDTRDRHAVSRKKSDHQDAVVLANILRTDTEFHRPLPADSDLVRAIAVLARAQQDSVWDRTRAHNRLRSHLREYYPAIIEAFAAKRERLLSREARTILAIAPTPSEAARLTRGRLRTAVTRAGRQRRIDAETDRLLQVFRQSRLRQPTLVERAMGRQTLALLAQLDAACQDTRPRELEADAKALQALLTPASPSALGGGLDPSDDSDGEMDPRKLARRTRRFWLNRRVRRVR